VFLRLDCDVLTWDLVEVLVHAALDFLAMTHAIRSCLSSPNTDATYALLYGVFQVGELRGDPSFEKRCSARLEADARDHET
jgi:hypothetical protein